MKINKSVKLLEEVYETYKGNPSRQIRELKKFITEGKKTGNTDLLGAAYFYTGYIYYELDDRDGVFTNALKAVAMLKDSENVSLIVRSYVMLGYGYGRQENYQMELDCYDKAYVLAGKILELMKVYAQKNPGTLEQLIAYRTMAEYYAEFGEEKLALEYYSKLDSLYETRLNEFQKIQLNVHNKMKVADRELLKLNRKIEESEERATKEPLTKLLNRATLLRVASDFIDIAARKKEKVGAIFIDIDFFKECNDTYGHVKGDEILKEVAGACQREETPFIRFARYGGDEFFGITHGLDDKEVTDIASRICERIRKADIPNEKNPNGHRVTLSVGVANVRISGQTDTIIEIANYADKAVYYSKNAGKNCIHLLDHGRKDDEGNQARFVKIDF